MRAPYNPHHGFRNLGTGLWVHDTLPGRFDCPQGVRPIVGRGTSEEELWLFWPREAQHWVIIQFGYAYVLHKSRLPSVVRCALPPYQPSHKRCALALEATCPTSSRLACTTSQQMSKTWQLAHRTRRTIPVKMGGPSGCGLGGELDARRVPATGLRVAGNLGVAPRAAPRHP